MGAMRRLPPVVEAVALQRDLPLGAGLLLEAGEVVVLPAGLVFSGHALSPG